VIRAHANYGFQRYFGRPERPFTLGLSLRHNGPSRSCSSLSVPVPGRCARSARGVPKVSDRSKPRTSRAAVARRGRLRYGSSRSRSFLTAHAAGIACSSLDGRVRRARCQCSRSRPSTTALADRHARTHRHRASLFTRAAAGHAIRPNGSGSRVDHRIGSGVRTLDIEVSGDRLGNVARGEFVVPVPIVN
jgi:hypothetical protein